MAKNIVLCFDGTGNNIGEDSTNIVKLYDMLLKDDQQQITFYHRGIATTDLKTVVKWYQKIKIAFQFLTGAGISKNIKDAYSYLMENFEPGDKVYLYGFSRGAYTARSLGGMLARVGLLTPDKNALLSKAYYMYSDKVSLAKATEFKKKHSRNCPVYVIGAFDTVGSLIGNYLSLFITAILSLGVLLFYSDQFISEVPVRLYFFLNYISWSWLLAFLLAYAVVFLAVFLVVDFIEKHIFGVHKFHNTNLAYDTGHAFHALAIDERRILFKPTLWNETSDVAKTKIKQVWFNGAHKDVGGYNKDQRLSDCSLQWMINRSLDAGLLFQPGYERRLHPDGEAPPRAVALYQHILTFFVAPFSYRKIPNGAKIHPTVAWRLESKKNYPRNLKGVKFTYSEK